MTEVSLPYFSEFKPVIPWQREALSLILKDFDYSTGTLEVLFSGTYGSAKSIAAAHLVVFHCLNNSNAIVGIGRKTLPDLKATLLVEILEHMRNDPTIIEGVDFDVWDTSSIIKFANGSVIMPLYWSDGRHKKYRSRKFSMVIFEEITENNDKDYETFKTVKARLNRIPEINTKVFIGLCNPDSPSHWVYRYFIEPNLNEQHPTRRVFYSNAEDNTFLDKNYIEQLKRDLPPEEADRYLRGIWREIRGDYVYNQYNPSVQYLRDKPYEVNKKYPIHLAWDFNIGTGKPMSMCLFQFINGLFHFFAESVIHTARTADILEDLYTRDLLMKDCTYEINGDAAGKHKDTRSTRSDYDIITQFLSKHDIPHKYCVPPANPAIRLRQNLVNAYCKNDLGDVRLFLYKGCKKLDEGLRLTKCKEGTVYIEDDDNDYQHIVAAAGYGLVYTHNQIQIRRQPAQRDI